MTIELATVMFNMVDSHSPEVTTVALLCVLFCFCSKRNGSSDIRFDIENMKVINALNFIVIGILEAANLG